MRVDFHPRGIHLPGPDLWLDCTEDCSNNWLSHGHSDHARGTHGRIIGTPATLDVYRMRVPEACPECVPIEYGDAFELNGAKLTALPASHIVGAAQLLVEYQDERLVYTGDIKLRAPLCGVETRIAACDRLIIESTFGLPIYRFIDRDAARLRIVEFATECLSDGISPVFIGYPLGRGQEILHVLCQAAIPTSVHGWIARFIRCTSAAGSTSLAGSRTIIATLRDRRL